MIYDVALFDADGVLTLPEDFFAVLYARSHGFPEDRFEPFFKGDFKQTSIGKADLKELIIKHKDLWGTDDPDDLLRQWFEAENVRNEELLSFIKQLRQQGFPVFVASVQEKYRAQYFEDTMFKDEFDGFYFSHSLGAAKPDPKFFESIMEDLQSKGLASDPAKVFFIDDNHENVEGAKTVGIDAYFYEGVGKTISLLQ